mgnify:CR=1 FL=1
MNFIKPYLLFLAFLFPFFASAQTGKIEQMIEDDYQKGLENSKTGTK